MFRSVMAALLFVGVATSTLAADRQITLDPASWINFEQREAMGREKAEIDAGTAIMAVGVLHRPGKSLRRYQSVSEFALPEGGAERVRSAVLQRVSSRAQCQGDDPLVLQLRVFKGDGTAAPEDAAGGAVVHTLQGACNDKEAFSPTLDVTASVKAAMAAGDRFIGFSLRSGTDRPGSAQIIYHKPGNPAAESQLHRLVVTLSGDGSIDTQSAKPADLSVYGVKLGMSPDETRDALRKRSATFRFKEVREPVERLRGGEVFSMLQAELPERIAAGPLERFHVHYALPPEQPRAVCVQRFGVFEPGREPSIADVKASLIKKYGEPSAVSERTGDLTLVWAHTPDGAVMADKTVLTRCTRYGAVASNVLLVDADSRSLSKGCGVTLWAHLDRNPIQRRGAMGFGDLASTLSLSLVDDTRFKEMRLAMKNHAAQSEHKSAQPFDLDKAPAAPPRPASAPVAAHTPWLAEMPDPDKVRAAIRGKDELDTAARQAAALYQLREMIGVLAGDRRLRNQTTDEERRLMRAYAEADGAVREPIVARFDAAETQRLGMKSPRAQWFNTYTGYKLDPAFTEDLLQRFFSPDFTRIWRQAKAYDEAKAAAAKPKEQTICFPSPCPPSMAQKSAAPAPEPEVPAKPDPAMAKARAAGVDTKVFGVPLGEPLRLPTCGNFKDRSKSMDGLAALGAGLRGISTATTCQSQGSMLGLVMGLVGAEGFLADRYILLAEDSCPPWAYCEVAASRIDGNLAGVTIMVQKGAREDQVGKPLRAKYGKPTRSETANYQNEFGARYEVDELEWNLPGLHVKYTPGPQGGGIVLVETETGRKAREARDTAREARQPKL